MSTLSAGRVPHPPFRLTIRRAATVRPDARIPQLAVPAPAFACYLVAVAALTALDAGRPGVVGVADLAVITGLATSAVVAGVIVGLNRD